MFDERAAQTNFYLNYNNFLFVLCLMGERLKQIFIYIIIYFLICVMFSVNGSKYFYPTEVLNVIIIIIMLS